MADYLTTDTELTSIANAIRTKGGTSAQLVYPAGFVSAINAIPSGGGGGLQWVECLDEPYDLSDGNFLLSDYIPYSQLEDGVTWRITISECYLSVDSDNYWIYSPVDSLNEPLILTGCGSLNGGMPLVTIDGPSQFWTIYVDGDGPILAAEVVGADYFNADVYGYVTSVQVLQ